MNAMSLDNLSARITWPEQARAIGIALALHVGLGALLFNLPRGEPLQPAVPTVIKTQLLTLPTAPAVPSLPEPVQEALQPAPPITPSANTVAKPVPAPSPQKADLALKRVEQQRKERALQAERAEQQRQRDEARLLEQKQAQERLAHEQQALAEQARLARQAEAGRQAAAAAAEQAASRQYLPIEKNAPDYPQTALDRRIEGECTVAYSVNTQGRVEDPHVVGTCHPLFIKPSLAAAKTFRYQPKIVNGQAVAVAEVKNTFSYKIR